MRGFKMQLTDIDQPSKNRRALLVAFVINIINLGNIVNWLLINSY